MGLYGAALSTAISISAINIAKFIEVYLIYKIHPYSINCLKGIIAIIIGFSSCYFLRFTGIYFEYSNIIIIFVTSFTFIVVTITIMYFLKLDEEDKALLNLVSKVKPRYCQ
jgi:hypothetical protein